MPDYSSLLNVIKQASTEAINASKPVNICFGKVVSANPLQILVDQKLTLGKAQLVLTRNVTDYKLPLSFDSGTDSGGGSHTHVIKDISGNPSTLVCEQSDTAHAHSISVDTEITIKNALKKEDTVILLRMQEGQQYIVLDRVV